MIASGASATCCYRIMLNIKCLDKVSNERIYDLTGTSPKPSTVFYSHDSSSSLATFGCMEKDANIIFTLHELPPPPPTGEDSQGDCISPFLFAAFI